MKKQTSGTQLLTPGKTHFLHVFLDLCQQVCQETPIRPAARGGLGSTPGPVLSPRWGPRNANVVAAPRGAREQSPWCDYAAPAWWDTMKRPNYQAASMKSQGEGWGV